MSAIPPLPDDDLALNSELEERPRRNLLGFLALTGLIAAAVAGWPLLTEQIERDPGNSASLAAEGSHSEVAAIATSGPRPTFAKATEDEREATFSLLDAQWLLSFGEAGYSQIFAYDAGSNSTRRLSADAWQHDSAVLQPSGDRIAFASNQSGHWDLYTLDLTSGEEQAVSDDLAYDGAPSWSADGGWLAYEHYDESNLDIYIRPIDNSFEPVQVSVNPGVDYAPAWSPVGQQIAFVSDRDGGHQIWLVNLEVEGEERFQNLTAYVEGIHSDPAWSPDGRFLAFSSYLDGLWRIYLLDMQGPNAAPLVLGSGELPAWSPDGAYVSAVVRDAEHSYLTVYNLQGGLAMPAQEMPAHVSDISWMETALPDNLADSIAAAADMEPNFGWQAEEAEGRQKLATLSEVNAPYPELNALAVDSFEALRQRASEMLGWDPMSVLENAYIPLTEPLSPGRSQDWLYTGRAFSLQPGLTDSGWMQVVREDYGGETFWRVYLRAADDAGRFGRPMHTRPWDFSARFSGDENLSQSGGQLMNGVPGGYWIDFTGLAEQYGWMRLPAHANWRNYYQGALFNEFALNEELSWEEALLEIYPSAVLNNGPEAVVQ